VTSKGVGKNKKMIWVPKGCAHVEDGVDVQTSTVGTTHKANLGDYKDKRLINMVLIGHKDPDSDEVVNCLPLNPKSLVITS
jgi:hypothetical protein